VERPKKVAIVDASVAAKWFVEEQFTEDALKMVEDYEARKIDLRSTQLMPFEVLNALRYNPEMGRSEIGKAGEALQQFRIALYPILGELKTLCLSAAFKHGLTVYDASYLALGQLLHSNVYTTDMKFISKTKRENTVHHVKEYSETS
jgi:predicted nucleic acid-binding protein